MTVGRGPVAIHSSGQTISSLAHIEGITLGADEEVTGLVKDWLLGCLHLLSVTLTLVRNNCN